MEKEIFDKKDLSPMMLHYVELKEKYQDVVILYRLGDFYELFFDDAIKCSKTLGLTLTYKNCGNNKKAPMCGIPQKSLDIYVAKLIELDEKVAVCEQLTEANNKEIVERDIVRIITPGTVVDSDIIDENQNIYIASIYYNTKSVGISYADISTGEFIVTEFINDSNLEESINNYLAMVSPKEIICNSEGVFLQNKLSCIRAKFIPQFTTFDIQLPLDKLEIFNYLSKQFEFKKQRDCECFNNDLALKSSYQLLKYINQTQKRHLTHINKLKYLNTNNFMQFDANTRLNLELIYSIKDRKKKNSLYWLLDKTKTSMGSRLLRSYIEKPLYDEKLINYRLDAVNDLYKNIISRQNIRESLSTIYDLERLCGRISYGNLTPKDCVALKYSLKNLPNIKNELSKYSSKMLKDVQNQISNFEDLYLLLDKAIDEDKATNNLKDSGFIKKGYNLELDNSVDIATNGVSLISALEARERDRTGIKGLKIKYNKVFGYFIEVLNSQNAGVPYDYIRRQTISNAERFVTEELKQLEYKILNANDDIIKLENSLFKELREILLNHLPELQNAAQALCNLDVIASFATVSAENNYVKPIINNQINSIEIVDGRHPVVEALVSDSEFVPNSTFLNMSDSRTMIITGPNMAGKSTYMRQVALITIMAHIGCFVPATSAKIALTDRIFTRIGANDDLSFGQSTFMVEMNEVSNILNNATNNSLVILDEVGRGTSTFDGLSIAWSVIEYISKHLNMKTLFATHFHELTDLETKLDGIKNYKISVKEFDGNVIFLRKIVRGSANKSFGIEVASLANLPKEVIDRAQEILVALESNELKTEVNIEQSKQPDNNKKYKKLYEILSDLNINNLTPLGAFDILIELFNIIKKDN